MSRRAALVSLSAALLCWSVGLRSAPSPLLDGTSVANLRLEAPLLDLFHNGRANGDYIAQGRLTNLETGTTQQVDVAVRGNTSRKDDECAFPKLKIKTPDGTLKIGTHCGESAGEQLTGDFGRLANEREPWRELLVYRIVEAAGMPTLRVRPARIEYVDSSKDGTIVPGRLTRNALLLEDDDDAVKRLGATGNIARKEFTTARQTFTAEDSARLAFAEAMVGNFDWCLEFTAGDRYRCDPGKKLWNLVAPVRPGGSAFPVMKDFDLAGIVTGGHNWFDTVYNVRAVTPATRIEAEVVAQVQRTRTLFSRALLDRTRREFVARRGRIYAALDGAATDAHGRELARAYLDAFYGAIETDEAFYRPVVGGNGTTVYADADGREPICGPDSTAPRGTLVRELEQRSGFSRVELLDVQWHWAPPSKCQAVRAHPVWIASSAITTTLPGS